MSKQQVSIASAVSEFLHQLGHEEKRALEFCRAINNALSQLLKYIII